MNEPVLGKDAIQNGVVLVVSGVAELTAAYGWWAPTAEQILAVGGAVGATWAFGQMIVSFFVRQKVTPEAHVEAIVEARVRAEVDRRVANLEEARRRHQAAKAIKAPKKAAKAAQRRPAA